MMDANWFSFGCGIGIGCHGVYCYITRLPCFMLGQLIYDLVGAVGVFVVLFVPFNFGVFIFIFDLFSCFVYSVFEIL